MDQMEQGRYRMAVNTALKEIWKHSAIKSLSLRTSGDDKLEGTVNFWYGEQVKEKTIDFKLTYHMVDNDDEFVIDKFDYS